MKTNSLYDGAWRDLQVAQRSENIGFIIDASERLTHAARLLRLESNDCDDDCTHQYNLNGYCIACGHHTDDKL